MKILIIGSSGMLGHMLLSVLRQSEFDVDHINRKPYLDSTIIDFKNSKHLMDYLDNHKFDIIINCIGILNNQADKNLSEALYINSYIPKLLEKKYMNSKTKIIQISTDCVFSGEDGPYYLDSIPNSETAYGLTKFLGEVVNSKDLTIRTSIIGPDLKKEGVGLLNWFIQSGNTIEGYKSVIWSGVTTLELSKFIVWAMKSNLTGLVHCSGQGSISKNELLELFNAYFTNNKKTIILNDQKKNNKVLINTSKWLGYSTPTYIDMIKSLSEWVFSNKELYPHYFSEEMRYV